MNKLPTRHELLLQPVTALALCEETVDVLEEHGGETVSDVLHMELMLLPRQAADEVRAALVAAGLLEGEGEEGGVGGAPTSDVKEASSPDVEIERTWCIVAVDGGTADPSTHAQRHRRLTAAPAVAA